MTDEAAPHALPHPAPHAPLHAQPHAPLRVLIVAENASVRLGGEASLPYHYFRVLRARGVDAWLILHERTRAEVELTFPADRDRLRFVPDMLPQKVFYRVSKLLPRRIGEASFGLLNQMLTQWAQRRLIRQLATERTAVHQPIPVSPRFPSLLFGLRLPVVIGPMNGGMDFPPAFREGESTAERLAIAAGRALSGAVNHLLPGKRNAALLLIANRRTQDALPLQPRGRLVRLVENGVDLTRWQQRPAAARDSPSFLFIGRLVDWKALDIAFEALAGVPGARLEIVGDGPMRLAWEGLTRQLGLAGRVTFHGWRSQDDCAAMLANSVALLLPSIYECGGAVVLEAMACARPVIATAWGGPEDYLDRSCGILIPPESRDSMTAGFRNAMLRLLQAPEEARALGEAGRAKVLREYDWEAKVSTMQLLYEQAWTEAQIEIRRPSQRSGAQEAIPAQM